MYIFTNYILNYIYIISKIGFSNTFFEEKNRLKK